MSKSAFVLASVWIMSCLGLECLVLDLLGVCSLWDVSSVHASCCWSVLRLVCLCVFALKIFGKIQEESPEPFKAAISCSEQINCITNFAWKAAIILFVGSRVKFGTSAPWACSFVDPVSLFVCDKKLGCIYL